MGIERDRRTGRTAEGAGANESMEPMGIERHRWASRQAEMSGSEQVNAASSGSGRVDDIKGHPQGEIRGQTKLVKSTEDARKYAAKQGIAESEALAKGLKEKSAEFVERGVEIYANGQRISLKR